MAESNSSDRSLQQVLEFLKGPTDERRFVGLLLAAKNLPQNEESAIKVFEAAGSKFIQRLFLSIQKDQTGSDDVESAKKNVAVVGLGLSLLSSFSRFPVLVSHEEILHKIPLFVKVVLNSGISNIVAPDLLLDQEMAEANKMAVQDSLDILTFSAEENAEARNLALESSALEAVVLVLNSDHSQKTWAVRLLNALLQNSENDQGQISREKSLPYSPKMLPPLASFFWQATQKAHAERELNGNKTAGGGNSQESKASGRASDSDENHGAHANEDLAKEQGMVDDSGLSSLLALHAMLAILPIPEGSQEEKEIRRISKRGRAEWAVEAKKGADILLRTKLGPSQRQAVLRWVTYFGRLMPSQWLLEATSSSFFVLLIQLVKIEIILFLRDALEPEAFIPDTKPQVQAVADMDEHQAEFEGWNLPDPADAAPDLEQRKKDRERLETMAPPAEKPGKQKALQRALEGLPAMLKLFGMCLEALAENSEGAVDEAAAPKSSKIPDSMASKAMGSLTEIADSLLQFLEELCAQKRDEVIAVIVSEGLGGFVAEAPDFEQQRVRNILPWLSSVQNGAGIGSFLPVFFQHLDHMAEAKNRESWAVAALKAQMVKRLSEGVIGLTDKNPSSALLYDSCLVLASLVGHLHESELETTLASEEKLQLLYAGKRCSVWGLEQLSQKRQNAYQQAPDLDVRLLAPMGVVAAYAALEADNLGNSKQQQSPEECMKFVLSVLEIADLSLSLPEGASQPPAHLQLEKLLNISAENQNGTSNGLRAEEQLEVHEEEIAAIEPQVLCILEYLGSLCSRDKSAFQLVAKSEWWQTVSTLKISDVDCKKSAYLRSLRHLQTQFR